MKAGQRVLKAAEVSPGGPFQLSIDPAAMADDGASRPSSVASSVRIVQSHPEYAVIEVTCPCGRTTLVRCDYAQTQ